MSENSKAVFLSYASQDSAAAKRIAEALRGAGVEVWFDQNELVGGDAWDAKIRKQIAECALFMPVISANTQARREGYFRLEWRIAVQRTHMMSEQVAFLLPLVVDETRDAAADVPVEFKSVQWTRLPAGETPAAFCARVLRLLGGAGLEPGRPGPGIEKRGEAAPSPAKPRPAKWWWVLPVLGVLGALYLAQRQPGPKPSPVTAPMTEAQRLVAQAKALIDHEPLATRETFRTAYELCENAAKLSPNDAEVWATMARANAELVSLYREGGEARVAATRSQAERALQLAPDSIEAGLAMAVIDLELLRADPVAVRAKVEGLLRRAPDDYRILLLIAQTEPPDIVSERAFRWLTRAEALPGGKARSALRQAWIYWGANRLRESLAAVERSLATEPLTEAYHLKLMLLCTMGDSGSAQKWLKQIPPLILREDRPASIAYETFYFSRQPEEALRVLRAIPREIFEEGRYFEVRALLAGEALLMAGKPRAAEVEFRTALKVIDERLATEPRNSRLWHAKGRAQHHLGDRTAAESSFTTARELGGLRTIDLAIQCQLLGQTEETLALVEQSLDRNITRWPSWLYYLKHNPAFDSLRGEGRFRQLIARAEAWMAEDLGTPAPESAVLAPGAGTPAVDDKSVAVLAFANLSDDKTNEYFSDGISEELLNVLAKVPGLKVSARTSAFYFKGKEVPVPEIAQQLGVAYVVEGSVRKQGDKVRITAQLIKAADGFHVWSDTFTRDLRDIFAVQDEIAGLIARQLQLKLAVGSDRGTVDPALYELLLQARALTLRESNEDWRQAIALYRRTLERESRLALAWAEMARTYVQLGRFGGMPIQDAMREARAAAQRALELEPDQATGLVALGWVQRTADWDWRAARRSFQRALELAPGNASIMGDVAIFYFNTGRVAEATTLARQAVERDPLNARAQASLGFILNLNGDWELALAPLRQAVALAPAIEEVRSHQARALMALGRMPEAAAAAEQEPNAAYRLIARAFIPGPAADAALAEFVAKYGEEMPGYVANIHGIRGEIEPAFVWFGRALARRDAAVAWVKTNINNRSLRADPRWPDFLRKVGLADDQLK